ncbi:MAG: response regulator transcription factor [Gemmatimonadaceae bacterium]
MNSTAEKTRADARALLLVVEDRPEVLDILQRTLAGQGYRVRTAADGDAAVALALDLDPDLVVLDVGLPKRDGFGVTAELRRRGFRAPVLMLTARGAVSDKVMGLEAGADDYLAKPFDYDELLARVRALLRRAEMRAADALLRAGDLALDPLSREVTRAGQPVALTQKEYALLEYLMRHAGHTVTREQISEHVWKAPLDPSTNIVDVYINYLRKKLEGDDAAAGGSLIRTVRGVGYELQVGQSPRGVATAAAASSGDRARAGSSRPGATD